MLVQLVKILSHSHKVVGLNHADVKTMLVGGLYVHRSPEIGPGLGKPQDPINLNFYVYIKKEIHMVIRPIYLVD